MTKELLKQALEYLQDNQHWVADGERHAYVMEYNAFIDKLKQALAQPTTTENNGGKTGWPPGLLQDDCKGLSKWLSNQPDARRRVREALAQPEQDSTCSNTLRLQDKPYPRTCKKCGLGPCIAQPKTQPEQEPVAWMCADESLINKGYARFSHVCMGDWKIPVYTTPPQRTWVGLTEEDLKLLSAEWRIVYGAWMDDFARDIEAKLKEKNT